MFSHRQRRWPEARSQSTTLFKPIEICFTFDGKDHTFFLSADGRGIKKIIGQFRLLLWKVIADGWYVGISIKRAKHLNPESSIPKRLPKKLANLIKRIKTNAKFDITHVWQIALIPTDWLVKKDFDLIDIDSLDLFLADYGLYTGMTLNTMPYPGNTDKPWNKDPYLIFNQNS